MNCSVPEFFLDEDPVFTPAVRGFADSSPFGEETVELLWDNGPVFRRTSQDELRNRCGIPGSSTAAEPFLEDEMASWLNYPLGEGEDRVVGGSDQAIEVSAPLDCYRLNPSVAGEGLKPPVAQQKFVRSFKSGESTIDDSIGITEPTMEVFLKHGAFSGGGKGETVACEQGITASSTMVSDAEVSDPKAPRLDSRKRKMAEAEDSDAISESIDKQDSSGGSALKRRLRAAEVHNLSERRRRDRINEKMKALQELLPRCNKSDKASMLDDAIRYLKFLQSQVQMMSMSCNMFPVMVPGIHHHHHSHHHHQFLPHMRMPLPMGMNMGLGVRAYNGPIPPPFFPVLSGSQMSPSIATHPNQGPPAPVDPTAAHSRQQQKPGIPHERSSGGSTL